MRTLVSDSSVLIDLERGKLPEACFRLPFAFSVPDLLFERELKGRGGDSLKALGLRPEALDGDGVALAVGYRRMRPALSLADGFALALAKIHDWTLLSGDRALRALASEEGVACHGVLWLLDRMFDEDAAERAALLAGLKVIAAHPRCRLPGPEIRKRIERYSRV